MRLEFFQANGAPEEWFFPQHTTPYKTNFLEKIQSASKLLPRIN
jgi:hypothetical protein